MADKEVFIQAGWSGWTGCTFWVPVSRTKHDIAVLPLHLSSKHMVTILSFDWLMNTVLSTLYEPGSEKGLTIQDPFIDLQRKYKMSQSVWMMISVQAWKCLERCPLKEDLPHRECLPNVSQCHVKHHCKHDVKHDEGETQSKSELILDGEGERVGS